MGAVPVQQNSFEAVALIVAKDENFKRSVIRHLWQNGVEAMFTSDLAEAQKMVIQYLPDFVFIPYDHPQYHDVAAFARKFGRLKSTQFIAYAETDMANPVPRLSLFPTKRAIHPPLAGESFLRHMKAVLLHLPNYKQLREQKQLLINNMKAQINFDPSTLGAAVQRALTAISSPDLDTTPERIEVTTRVTCAILEADFYKGFLVGVQGGDMEEELEFFNQFRESLFDFLREKGIHLPTLQFKQLRIRKTHFNGWAQAKASIYKMSFHENRETALAFFEAPLETVHPLGAIGERGMAPIDIKNIEFNSPYPVDLYMFSETAFKFTVYLKKGRAFKEADVKKLSETNVSQLFVCEDDVETFSQFTLVNFLEDSIEEYNAEARALDMAERGRMSNELEMAKVIQDALFPETHYEDDFVKIKGHYRTSSECGGDWWHYSLVNDKLYLWLGDATGHGVPAALVTSAAKASSSLIYHYPDMALNDLMSVLNHAVFGTSNGKIQMTFYLACLDLRTGKINICNASHEPPMVFPIEKDLKKKDIQALPGYLGPRLGEDLKSVYFESTETIKVTDRIFFYTDGIPELENPTGQQWSEQKMIRSLLQSFRKGPGIETAMTDLEANIEDFRAGTPLVDDITYFMLEFKKKKT